MTQLHGNWTTRVALVAIGFITGVAAASVALAAPGRSTGGQGQQSTTNSPRSTPTPIPPVDDKPLREAKKQSQAAREAVVKAQRSLSGVTGAFQAEYEARPEVASAIQSLNDAHKAYDAVADPVIKEVRGSDAYKKAVAAAVAAEDQVTALKTKSDATAQERLDAAKAALDARSAVTKLETDALTSDSQVVSAKQTYTSAAATLAKLKGEEDQAMHQDVKWVAAKKSLEEAKAASASADESLAEARQEFARQQTARNAAVAQQQRMLEQQRAAGR